MQFKNLAFLLVAFFACVLLAGAAPIPEKKALKQLVIKRGEGPTPVARAEEGKPSHYKRASEAKPSGYKRAEAAKPSGYKRAEAAKPSSYYKRAAEPAV